MRDFSNFSEEKFQRDLTEIDWETVVTAKEANVNKLFSNFYNKINKVTNKHAPFKAVSKRKEKMMEKPWITKGIRASIKIKNELLTKGNRDLYKFYRNKVLNLTRLSKKLYFHNYFQLHINNAKKTWEGINSLINNKKKTRKSICALKRPSNHLSFDQQEHANILNNHFATVGPKLASKIPICDNAFSKYLPNITYNSSFVFDPVLPREVELEIMRISPKKSVGLYSCPARLLQCGRGIISTPLSTLINISIERGSFPTKLKHAKIIPVFKDGDETDPGNYRPISLLSIFNRIFEKLMYNRLKHFLEKHNILTESQYGFRERRSTEHAILDIVGKIKKNMDNSMFTCGVFIDLKKAFDTVDHDILLYKLYHYGIRGVVQDWFRSYLTERIQTTEIGHHISTKEKVLCGVPQGSVLGPLLFLIYVNDICRASTKLDLFLFADDTNLLYADKKLKTLETIVNTELMKVYDWMSANKLSLNIKKSNFIIFHSYQKRINYNITLKLYDNQINRFVALERKDYVKYLGVLLDSNLTWKHHISYVAAKISRNIGIIARLRHFSPFSTLLHIYHSLVSPYLYYGLTAWGQACKTHLQTILVLQKRAMRLMNFADYSEHAIPFFVSSNILPLPMLFYKLTSIFMHDVNNKLVPSNISEPFVLTQNVHNYSTRSSSSGHLYINRCRTNIYKNSIFITGAKIWNSFPEELRKQPRHRFKQKVHQLLLQILQKTDNYIYTDQIIIDMKSKKF